MRTKQQSGAPFWEELKSKMNRIILASLLFLSACDLFTTRVPESPDSGRSQQITAVTPQQLFENFENSFKEKFLDNYMICLADTVFIDKKFVFIPDGEAASRYPILNDWNLNSEKQYFNNFISQTKKDIPVILTLTEVANNSFGDSAYYQFDYSLLVPFQGESESAEYSGTCKFTICLDRSNKWVITRWEDIAKADVPSWSQLKRKFAN